MTDSQTPDILEKYKRPKQTKSRPETSPSTEALLRQLQLDTYNIVYDTSDKITNRRMDFCL